jgi:hypothetical protein
VLDLCQRLQQPVPWWNGANAKPPRRFPTEPVALGDITDARTVNRVSPTVPGSHTAERRHARDERDSGCCDTLLVGDDDPVMHPYASVPDLVALIGPRYGSASFQ